MAKDTRQEELRRHFIPVNFIDESKVFNGMINRRNAIEGGILFGVVAFISEKSQLSTTRKRWMSF